MRSSEELEQIYNERYAEREASINLKERKLYAKLNRMLLPSEFTNDKVEMLDLGCGRAHKTLGFGEKFEKIVAIDLSEKVIEHCKSFYLDCHNVEFVAGDATKVIGKFNLITAFGFSLFNTPDSKNFIDTFRHFSETNLDMSKKSFFIIGSFTDFSGTGSDSWYLHTKNEIRFLKEQIERLGFKVNLVFPHKKIKNYVGFGMYNFIAESIKCIIKRKKTFFIVIEHG